MGRSVKIKVKDVEIGGGGPLVLIAGPCVIESEKSCLELAEKIKKITAKIGIGFIFKASYDKANRSSIDSYRGPGLERGLKILNRIKKRLSIPILSDVHCRTEVREAAKVLDVLQVPAFLSRQTDLIVAVAKTKKVINIKKGQFLAPYDIGEVVRKIESSGNRKILITERGTCFGYNNLVSDFRSLLIMRKFGYPVIYDATHSVQLPTSKGISSGGSREFVPGLSRAAVAVGCDGLFLEVHSHPDRALCDGPNMIDLKNLEELLLEVKRINNASRMK